MLALAMLGGGAIRRVHPRGGMPRIDTGQFDHPAGARVRVRRGLATCAVAAMLAAAPGTAQAAVPRVGAWETSGRFDPRVSFDVRGPTRSRFVQRVSFPITCKGNPSPVGWGAPTAFASAPAGSSRQSPSAP
jgi:hypothetical protein